MTATVTASFFRVGVNIMSRQKGDVAASMFPDRSMASASPSSSDLSKLILDDSIYGRIINSVEVDACAEFKLYSLCDLRSEMVLHQRKGDSDRYCSHYIKTIIDDEGLNSSYKMGKSDTECEYITKLSPLTASTKQRPDVSVYNHNNFPVLFIEVHSTSFVTTIRKCIIGVSDQLRLYRMYDCNYSSLTAFAFPKLPLPASNNRQCVIQVEVALKGLRFEYFLTPLKKIEVRNAVLKVLQNIKLPSGLERDIALSRYPFRLTEKELKTFPGGSVSQVPSARSILLKSEKHFFKHPLSIQEMRTLDKIERSGLKSDNVISLMYYETSIDDFFRYDRVTYDPLSRSEAACCLHDLVLKIKQALQSLHSLGWTHQDVRLPNICFSENFDAVFIDLDRCRKTNKPPIVLSGCLYHHRFSATQTDYLQLGWLIVWIFTCKSEYKSRNTDYYHNRSFEDLNSSIKGDNFLKKLILEGKYTK